MTYGEFSKDIKSIEERHAYGSETPIYGHFVKRMIELASPGWRESEETIPQDEADWWRRAYELYGADQELPGEQQARDIQEIFNQV